MILATQEWHKGSCHEVLEWGCGTRCSVACRLAQILCNQAGKWHALSCHPFYGSLARCVCIYRHTAACQRASQNQKSGKETAYKCGCLQAKCRLGTPPGPGTCPPVHRTGSPGTVPAPWLIAQDYYPLVLSGGRQRMPYIVCLNRSNESLAPREETKVRIQVWGKPLVFCKHFPLLSIYKVELVENAMAQIEFSPSAIGFGWACRGDRRSRFVRHVYRV